MCEGCGPTVWGAAQHTPSLRFPLLQVRRSTAVRPLGGGSREMRPAANTTKAHKAKRTHSQALLLQAIPTRSQRHTLGPKSRSRDTLFHQLQGAAQQRFCQPQTAQARGKPTSYRLLCVGARHALCLSCTSTRAAGAAPTAWWSLALLSRPGHAAWRRGRWPSRSRRGRVAA